MKQKPPAFQFYPKQWLGDDKIMLMDWDAQAMHLRLMCISWQQDNPGTLPNEESIIRRWLRNPSEEVWTRVWPQIKQAWQTSQKNALKLYSRALIREYRKQQNFSESRKHNALKRWKKQPNRHHASALHKQNTSNALQSSSSSSYSDIPPNPLFASQNSTPNGNGETETQKAKRLLKAGRLPPGHYDVPESEIMGPDEFAKIKKLIGPMAQEANDDTF